MSAASPSVPVARGRLQFRLTTLLALFTGIACACVAIRTPTTIWQSIMIAVTFLALAGAVLFAIYREGKTRAFALGFVLFGGLYMLTVFALERTGGQMGGAVMIRDTSATRLSNWLFQTIHAKETRTMTMPASGGVFPGPGGFGGGGIFNVAPGEAGEIIDEQPAASEEGTGDPFADPPPASGTSPGDPFADSSTGSSMPSGMPGSPGGMPGGTAPPGGVVTYQVAVYNLRDLQDIVHCTLALLIALLGGITGQVLYVTRGRS